MALSDKLQSLRESISKRQERKEAKRKKQRTKQAAQNLRSKRRVRKNNPEGLVEEAQASKRQAKKLAGDLGITDRASALKMSADGLTDSVSDSLNELDAGTDDGGDFFDGFEAALEESDGAGGRGMDVESGSFKPVDAAMDDEGLFEGNEGSIEDDLEL